MAEIVVSAFLTVVFEKLASANLNKLVRSNGIHSELKKWERLLSQIQSLLNDASQKEITDEAVKRWLNSLQHLAYDIDDILDDLATQAMHRELTEESGAITGKVRKLIPTCCTNFSLISRMDDKLNYITTKLQDLVEEKNNLGLIVKDGRSKNINRRIQTSLLDASSIVGREVDKEALLQKLLGDEPCNQNFSIVPIVGMGGVGKTTLARLLYEEKQVKDHFELKAWVCVSDEFDSFNISKIIFQSVTGVNTKFADLNLLQVALRDQLNGKRFLLVLDDVWSESFEDWETLVAPFLAGAAGSKIIMTTRKQQLLKKLGYDHPYDLQSLSYADALSLFAQHALGVNNFDSHTMLKPYGEGIVKKCDGLPLALRALGRLLRTKTNAEDWRELLNSEIWRSQKGDEIVPALRLSYYDLSACLKQLFAYCSLFPKDYLFDKEDLILLWMAEGFLHQTIANKSKERLGNEYFEELLSRSFFQHAPNDKSYFVMYDLMNDLATFVAGDFFLRLDNETEKRVGSKTVEQYRHMSFVREEYIDYEKFKMFKRAKSLRTFLATSPDAKESWRTFFLSDKILVDLLPTLPSLRILCLSHIYGISEVPESIGSLKHLRYLNLSRTSIRHLPENVCNLYNLQTLIVFSCVWLIELPNNFSKLKNLRHLDARGTPFLNKMPIGIGVLKNLQTISKIIIGGENGFDITKLKDLKNLQGEISIQGLEKVLNATDAREADLSQKRLSELELEWCHFVFNDSRKETLEKEVLSVLKPCNDNLEKLRIMKYGGVEFPNWIGDPSFLRLAHVLISSCRKCTSLPPLGQLPSLKELFIENMDEVKIVGLELLGPGIAFPSLEILSIKNMNGWEVWSTKSGFGGTSFPCLRELHIESCFSLVEVSVGSLPSVRILKIDCCGDSVLRSLVRVASFVTRLEIGFITGLTDEVWGGVIENLGAVEELSIRGCSEIRYVWVSEAHASKDLVNIRKLYVSSCSNLVSLGEKEDGIGGSSLTSFKILDIWNCESMERCRCPNSIETLNIISCSSIKSVSFPTRGQKLKSLLIYDCKKLSGTELGGGEKNRLLNNTSMPILESVCISSFQNLKLITELNYFIHLTRLDVEDCPHLESFPDHELPNLKSLTKLAIAKCPSMDASFPRGFWPPKFCMLRIGQLKNPMLKWGQQNFPTSLVSLTLCCGPSEDVSNFSRLSHLLPSSLTRLTIDDFEKLESLSLGFQHLTSLQHLTIEKCPKVIHLPEMILGSLLSLRITECPTLNERSGRGGSYWPLISHIPSIYIGTDT